MVLKTRRIHEIVEVEANHLIQFKRYFDLDCFIYKGSERNVNGEIKKKWFICDYQTGIAMSSGKTKDKAIDSLIEYCKDEKRLKALKDVIEKSTRRYGIINELESDE